MTATLHEFGIDQLPAAKKIALANELLDSVAADNSTNLNGSLPLHAQFPPLRVEEGGVIRVGKTRISLDLIVEQYEDGMTPDEMVHAYDSLKLEDVHSVIAYYLRHTDEVRAYVKRRVEEAKDLQAKIEAESPPITRSELLARRAAREKEHAPAGQ